MRPDGSVATPVGMLNGPPFWPRWVIAAVAQPGRPSWSVISPSGEVWACCTEARSFGNLRKHGIYYFVPGVNSLGCAGMGQDSEGADIPGAGTGCPSAADCRP